MLILFMDDGTTQTWAVLLMFGGTMPPPSGSSWVGRVSG